MRNRILLLSLLFVVSYMNLYAITKNNDTPSSKLKTTMTTDSTTKVLLKTTEGDITLALYNDTPKHRDNFIKLVEDGTYNGTLFHRVIKEFMIQGGDVDSKTAKPNQSLGSGDVGYTLEKEIIYPEHFHKRGALAAARTGDQVNPEKRSSGSQFYIVTGKVFTKGQLDAMQKQRENRARQNIFQELSAPYRKEIMKMQIAKDNDGVEALRQKLIDETEKEYAKHPATFTDEQIKEYTTIGGAPHLDGEYTVYGEVISGMDIVDKIESVETDYNDRPNNDIKIIEATIINK